MNALAYFVSSHGFGHATRASAVMAALQRRFVHLHCHIFTRVPPWLFEESLQGPFTHHCVETDVGLVQRDAMQVDLAGTVAALDRLLPYDPHLIDRMAGQVREAGCDLVLCDIAPMGVAVAEAAGLPSLVVENFTWDWIYAAYALDYPPLAPFVDRFRSLFSRATYHVQAEPSGPVDPAHWPADCTVSPISREARTPAVRLRQAMDVPAEAQLVLVTMGGTDWSHTYLDRLSDDESIHYVLPAGETERHLAANLHILPHRSGIYHPDLVMASDAVVGKIGYSTLAETYQAGIPYGYVSRQHFRESQVLADFVHAEMTGLAIHEEELRGGDWIQRVPDLLALPRMGTKRPNGAGQVADFIVHSLPGS